MCYDPSHAPVKVFPYRSDDADADLICSGLVSVSSFAGSGE